MRSIKENIEEELIIKKSKFITKLIKIKNEQEVKNILQTLKNKYKDATHVCFAYKIHSIKKCSDDGEPSGTAGIPILNILDMQDLDCILCVIIRYFGGIKLGASGLIRAYANCTKSCIDESIIVELEEGKLLELCFYYNSIKQIEYLLEDFITDKKYDEMICYKVQISNSYFNKIKINLEELCISIKQLEHIMIEKNDI